jgi:hypothetical protein
MHRGPPPSTSWRPADSVRAVGQRAAAAAAAVPAVGDGGRGLPSSWASCQQVGHQHLHAVGLLLHQREHALRSAPVSGRLAMVSTKPASTVSGRADLMRDVGHEVAPHAVGAFAFGDVLRQHQLLALAIGAQHHRQRALPAGAGQA